MLLEGQGTASSTSVSPLSTLSAETTPLRQVTSSASESLARARSMMRNSTNGGVFRRLNQSERLRASSATQAPKGKKEKKLIRRKRSLLNLHC